MKQTTKTNLAIALSAFLAFILWTIAITIIDLQPIGPKETVVGFATINGAFHALTGVHWLLYNITDWMGLIAVLITLGFGVLGFCQMVHRRSIIRVDADILILGAFYVLVIAAYLVFEMLAINYRPVLVEGNLEASYPSSTTLLVLCVIPTAIMQMKVRIRSRNLRRASIVLMTAFAAFMVVGRTLSGVHWLTDIIGGILLSLSLVMFYRSATSAVQDYSPKHPRSTSSTR